MPGIRPSLDFPQTRERRPSSLTHSRPARNLVPLGRAQVRREQNPNPPGRCFEKMPAFRPRRCSNKPGGGRGFRTRPLRPHRISSLVSGGRPRPISSDTNPVAPEIPPMYCLGHRFFRGARNNPARGGGNRFTVVYDRTLFQTGVTPTRPGRSAGRPAFRQ